MMSKNFNLETINFIKDAKLIGLSVTHLNYLCREFYGCSALGVLHQRLDVYKRQVLRPAFQAYSTTEAKNKAMDNNSDTAHPH